MQNDIEKNKLAQYKENIAKMNAEEQKLSELRAQIKELSFSKGPRDTAKIRSLRDEATKTANRIATYDKMLVNLEASKPIRDIISREKAKVEQRLKDRYKAAQAEYKADMQAKQDEIIEKYRDSRKKAVEERNRTVIRNKIKSLHGKINTMLNNPTDGSYIPKGLISAALDTLSAVDIRTGKTNNTQAALTELYEKYEALKRDLDEDYKSLYDDEVAEVIQELRDIVKDKNIYDDSLSSEMLTNRTIGLLADCLILRRIGGIILKRCSGKEGMAMKAWQHFKTITKHHFLVLDGCFRVGLYRQGLLHDLSKYSYTEFHNGAHYYQGTRSPNAAEREEKGYSEAWMHHKGCNRHHFEYWTDMNLQTHTYEPVSMPRRYLAEMVMDRIAACKTYQGRDYTDASPLNYFDKSREKMLMHEQTRQELSFLLTMLRDKGEKETFRYIRKVFLKNR